MDLGERRFFITCIRDTDPGRFFPDPGSMVEDPYLSQFRLEKSKNFSFIPLGMLREKNSVAEPHHFYAAPALSPALPYSKAKFSKELKFKHRLKLSFLLILYRTIYIAENMN
jgi:hypothetical protein